MHIPAPRCFAFCALFWLSFVAVAQADPQLSSWYTARSARYARIYKTSADETSQTASTTWSRGSGTQTLPTYSGVSEILYSSSWIYIRTTGLGSHLMGPWYLDSAKSQLFPNYPSNTATIYRIPRSPVVPSTKTLTGGGAIGYFVNGVAFFDNRDTFSYVNSSGTDATPVNHLGQGDGIWNRDAYPNELVTFDAALAHQAGNQYHYHVQPIALRYQLGDHVDYNTTTNRYAESANSVTQHSPIIAWAADGYPVYGPYGYSSPNDSTSGVRRMVSGYVQRNGQNGTTNLATTGRHTLPAWAAAAQNRSVTLTSSQYGPTVSTTYPLGHYLEDNDYLGDLGKTQGSDFDLDKYNGRTCVTPEFPGGTYAYFTAVNADGSPAFPYNIGRWFYGSPTGGTVSSISESVTTFFHGGPNKTETATSLTTDSGTGNTTFTWSALEGGTYRIDRSFDLSSWSQLTTKTATNDSASVTDAAATLSNPAAFYRTTRTALASFDSNGFDYP